MNKNQKILLFFLGVIILSLPSLARAWGRPGHQLITKGAIFYLDGDLRMFFEINLQYIANLSGNEPPGSHFIAIDTYPTFDENNPYSVPRDYEVLCDLYGTSYVSSLGEAPWNAVGYVESLTQLMSEASSAQDWQDLLLDAARLAHYLGDLHNPLHLTWNYNGQLTGNDGIHFRYEAYMVSRYQADLLLEPLPGEVVQYITSPLDSIFDSIYIHFPLIDVILEADTTHRVEFQYGDYDFFFIYPDSYYEGMWEDTGAFTQQSFRDGSQFLASLWYTAWIDAGSPAPLFFSGDGDADLDGDVDLLDFSWFQVCYTGPDEEYSEARCSQLDFDADRDIDELDFQSLETVLRAPTQ